jgi:AcrR family transcriptional regulator
MVSEPHESTAGQPESAASDEPDGPGRARASASGSPTGPAASAPGRSAPGGRNESAAQAEAFRERIVQASTELIQEQGLSALSMREVARRAGVSHQAPYYYFADREAILGAIAEQGFRMMRDFVQRSVPEHPGAAHEAIIAGGHAYLEFAFAHPAHFRVMFRPELVSPERHPNVQGEGLRACDTFFRIVESAVHGGLPAAPSVDALFLTCWSFAHGLACLVLDGPLDVVSPNVDRKAQVRDAVGAFGHMMEASIVQAKGARNEQSPNRAARGEARGSAREQHKAAKKPASTRARAKKKASEPRR